MICITVSPGLGQNYDTYIKQGLSSWDAGQFDRAIVIFTRAIEQKPDDPWAYGNRGFAYLQKSLYDEAIADFTMAIALDATDAAGLPNYKKANITRPSRTSTGPSN